MKSFAIYRLEEEFLKSYKLQRSDLFIEMIDFATPSGPAYSRQFAGRKRTNKIFISDNDTVFDKFVQSAMKKLGSLVVAGALLFLKLSYKSISYFLRFAGKTVGSILQFLAEKGSSVLSGLYKSLKDYLESTNDLSDQEKDHVRNLLN